MAKTEEVLARQGQIVEADIAATHAYQVLLALSSGEGDPGCWSAEGLSKGELEALVAHQESLLSADPAALAAWAEGERSDFDPARDLEPILAARLESARSLPVNLFTDYLLENTAAAKLEARAVASLYQTALEVERDGALLEDEFRLYIALGLPVYVGQLGLPGGDGDLFEVGKSLAAKTCPSPFDTDAAAWQIAGRKIWNWGEKNLRVRDAAVLAAEILAEPDMSPLIPKIRALAPRKIAVIGHSFTIDGHWSSPSAFAPIVRKIFEAENPAVETRQWFGGGLTASRALKKFYDDALAWKPDQVLFVVVLRGDDDDAALREMAAGLGAAGAEVYCFDTIRDPSEDARTDTFGEERAREFGLEVIEVGAVLAASPHRREFVCLDGVHMREPYHRLMAREWLKFLVGARGAALPAD